MNKSMGAIALSAAALLAGPAVHAAGYPTKPVTMIVPFVPGGSSDITARSVTPGLTKALGQTFVVENKPGANSAIGAQALARSTADGYTMMVGSIGTFAINEALYKNLSYNPSKDFEYLTQAVRNPNVLVASPSFPANTVAELVDYANKNPGKVSYASSGTGSSDHLSAVMFRQRTQTSGVDVPYRGGGAAIADLMGGQVNVSFQNLGAVQTHIKAGKLKALAVSWPGRLDVLPDVPTYAQLGFANNNDPSWFGLVAPAGTPAAAVDRIQQAVAQALQEPAVRERLAGQGLYPSGTTPKDFSAQLVREIDKMKRVAAYAKIALD